jgi:Predicted membrane protein (DUF2157)
MNPDVADAIPRLAEAGVLPPDEAPRLLRVARGELLSVHWELRALLYVGVLLITGGVGLLVKENLDRIGPVAIAAGIGLAAAAALGWVIRVAPSFSWQEVPSPNLAFDYILLLGVLLVAADLAYVEVKFTPLGPDWSWHLLIVAVFAALAAFRFDSRVVFSLALSTFAAWRGVSAARFGTDLWWKGAEDAVRWNAIACGALFAVLGLALKRTDRKAHFEPVAVTLGWLLILGALASGMDVQVWRPWTVALLLTGLGLAAGAFLVRRFPLFAFGVVAAYAALSRLALHGVGDTLGCFWFFITPIPVIVGLILAQRRLREPA